MSNKDHTAVDREMGQLRTPARPVRPWQSHGGRGRNRQNMVLSVSTEVVTPIGLLFLNITGPVTLFSSLPVTCLPW